MVHLLRDPINSAIGPRSRDFFTQDGKGLLEELNGLSLLTDWLELVFGFTGFRRSAIISAW